jgi:hypothetical protein
MYKHCSDARQTAGVSHADLPCEQSTDHPARYLRTQNPAPTLAVMGSAAQGRTSEMGVPTWHLTGEDHRWFTSRTPGPRLGG